MNLIDIVLELPGWLKKEVPECAKKPFLSLEERMKFAIWLSRRNVEEKTGGPFGAAVFEMQTGRLVAPGVNTVVTSKCSLAHAEVMAMTLAQKGLKTFTLGANGLPKLELVTSAQPCTQCFGAIWWAGVKRVVIGASAEQVEALTDFKEGPLPDDWVGQLRGREAPLEPVEVVQDVLADEACAVLKLFTEMEGEVYNA